MTTKSQQPSGTTETRPCRACGGKGYVKKAVPDGPAQQVRCIQCGGSGKSSGYVTK